LPQVLAAMFGPRIHGSSETLRARPWDDSQLLWALVISVVVHLSAFGVFKVGQHYNLWEKIRVPAWVQRITDALVPALAKRAAQPPKPKEELPLMFIEVSPDLAVADAPKDARHYAAHSTRATQTDPADKDLGVPKISGQQEQVPRTEDSKLSRAQPLQPALPQPKPEEAPQEEPKPVPALLPNTLTLGKPSEQTKSSDSQSDRPRRMTVAEAKARQAQQQGLSTAGQKMRQDGGAQRRGPRITLDAVGTPFGAYDAAVVAAVQERWYGLLEQRSYASDKSGKVVLEFRLNYDGRVTDLVVAENTVDELLCLLCQKAILDPSPYGRWPAEMRRLVNGDSREVRFTFYYN
jgi:outer membrane biosynthesis protein TonB